MKSIYKSAEAKQKIIALYDRQIKELHIPYEDIYIETSYGRTHVIACGNEEKPPLLVFHGGNATTAYNLKSAETLLPPFGQAYGRWAKEVIEKLGYEKMACFGGSFGAGILVKLMCVAPKRVSKSVLLVPSAIRNAPSLKSMNMMFPMCMYLLTHSEKWFIKCILPMAVREENISKDILETAKCSIDNAKVKSIMPQNERTSALQKYKNPVLVMAAAKDCLFPAAGVLRRAKAVWQQSRCYLLRDRGHIHELTEKEKKMIINALR